MTDLEKEARELLVEAQVAVAIAAAISNSEWTDLWLRIQKYLDKTPAGNEHEDQNPVL